MDVDFQALGYTTVDYIYMEIRKKIMYKELHRGQRLAEGALAKEFNVSRTPVREAIRRLANDGLVNIIPNWGAHLIVPTREEVIDICEVRQAIEVFSIKKAVHKITPIHIYKLEEQIALEEKAARENDVDAYIKANNSFHLIIAEASGSKALSDIISTILSKVVAHLLFYEDSLFKFETNPALNKHKKITEALKNHDEAKCVRLMKLDIYPWIDAENKI